MKRLILISLLLILLAALAAVPVSQSVAEQVALAWMQNINPQNAISDVQPFVNPTQSDMADWYLVSFRDGGFILVSAEDKASPILGFDTTGFFNNSSLPENLAWFLNQYHAELAALRTEADLSAHPGWQSVLNYDFSGYLPTRPVSPLLTTAWDQGWPYNSLCPTDSQGPGGHVYAGCGATTMAQIMKFWAYPTTGTGSHSYNHTTYGMIGANFGNTTYNYASMPNSLYFTPNTAISTLQFHCGVALNMDYGPDGSGSYVTDVRPAFINYFSYESTAQTVYKYAYTTANWESLLRTELNAARPIFYFGTDTSQGGHAWVCDGYSGTNYFHMNWGWSGSANGYFYVSNLNPGGYAFNTNQGAVIGLRPTVPVSAPTNLTVTVDAGNNVFLEWTSPVARSLLGFTIYRNGTICGSISDPINTSFYDINLLAGTYSYYVVANFSSGDSGPSNTVVATVYPAPVINYQESFETFSDFTTTLTPWFGYDIDLAETEELDWTDFPGEGNPMSFMVFNPNTAVPPLPEFSAFNYNKLLVCMPSEGVANDDWFCSPKWNTGNIARLRFWAKSALADSGLAQIKVGVSTATPDPVNMTIISRR